MTVLFGARMLKATSLAGSFRNADVARFLHLHRWGSASILAEAAVLADLFRIESFICVIMISLFGYYIRALSLQVVTSLPSSTICINLALFCAFV